MARVVLIVDAASAMTARFSSCIGIGHRRRSPTRLMATSLKVDSVSAGVHFSGARTVSTLSSSSFS